MGIHGCRNLGEQLGLSSQKLHQSGYGHTYYFGEFYLCQGPEQLAALQRDLPEFTLRHASETFTTPVKGWPGIFWSHQLSDDALATRVTIDIDTATAYTITTTLWIGHQAPNLTQVHHTFRRTGSTWKLVKREEGPEIKI